MLKYRISVLKSKVNLLYVKMAWNVTEMSYRWETESLKLFFPSFMHRKIRVEKHER